MNGTPICEMLQHCAELTNKGIEDFFASLKNDNRWCDELSPLIEAMEYSMLSGGKRIRPFLAMQFAAVCGRGAKTALHYAVALEMVHTYSLIHDDLPCMDDDDLRRGRKTNHVVYGEARALLAGDSLLTHAFGVVAQAPLSAKQNLEAIKTLADAAGAIGMAGGQEIDLSSEGTVIDADLLARLHSKKTGEMIKASCLLGCISAGVFEGDSRHEAAKEYAHEIGLAFQIVDDILDVVGSDKVGKPIGSDKQNGKTTYVTLYGIDTARKLASKHVEKAKEAVIKEFGEISSLNLCEIAQFIIEREN